MEPSKGQESSLVEEQALCLGDKVSAVENTPRKARIAETIERCPQSEGQGDGGLEDHDFEQACLGSLLPVEPPKRDQPCWVDCYSLPA